MIGHANECLWFGYSTLRRQFGQAASYSLDDATLTRSKFIKPGLIVKQLSSTWKDASILDSFKRVVRLAAFNDELGSRSTFHGSTGKRRLPLDDFFIKLYQHKLKLQPSTSVQVMYEVCSQAFDAYDDSSYITQMRLDMLDVSNIITNLYDPLSNIGIRSTHKLLKLCPSLVLATLPSPTKSNQDSSLPFPTKVPTILDQALGQLSSLLNHNDMIQLLLLYPGALLRSPSELTEIYEFLTETMGLESTKSIRASINCNKERHLRRHQTCLNVAQCPAWEMNLVDFRARYLLLKFSGCWPLPTSVHTGITNKNRYLAHLLTCKPGQFHKWFSLNFTQPTSKTDSSVDCLLPDSLRRDIETIRFTKSDVLSFESLCAQVIDEYEFSSYSGNEDDNGEEEDNNDWVDEE